MSTCNVYSSNFFFVFEVVKFLVNFFFFFFLFHFHTENLQLQLFAFVMQKQRRSWCSSSEGSRVVSDVLSCTDYTQRFTLKVFEASFV